jgi:hypothetical protein
MAAVGTVRIVWGNGEDDFCIARPGEIFALEDKTGAGLGEIRMRLQDGSWRLTMVRETIRLALIGAGMDADKAMKAVELHVDNNVKGYAPSILIAHAIVAAALVGVPDDPVGKTPAPGAAKQDQVSSTTTVASDALRSMESGQA